MTYNVYLTNLNCQNSFPKNSILLGEWCLSNIPISPSAFSIIPYHWRASSKFSRDIEMLTELYPSIFQYLIKILENRLSIQRSDEFWHTVIGPSLSVIIPTLWDRWESVTPILQLDSKYSILFYDLPSDCVNSTSHSDLIFNSAYSQRYNQYLFQQILQFRSIHSNQLNIKYIEEKPSKPKDIQYRPHLYSKLILILNKFKSRLAGLFSSVINDNIFFYKDSLPFLFKVRFFLGTRPFSFRILKTSKFSAPPSSSIFPLTSYTPPNSIINQDIASFVKFLYDFVIDLLPYNFKSFSYYNHIWIRNSKYTPQFIFTAGAHLSDDDFKLWSAIRVSRGSKLFIAPHGGAIPQKYMDFGFHERFPDRLTWWVDCRHKFRRIFPGILIRHFKELKYSKTTKILFIGYEGTTFIFRPESVGQGCFTNDIFDHIISLYQSLPDTVQKFVTLRPYPTHGWNLFDRYSKFFKSTQISNATFYHDLASSSLVICTYPQTAYLQSFALSIPTILFYLPEIWITDPQYDDLLQQMNTHHLISSDPQSTARHIIRIFHNPLTWWNTPEIVNLRTAFTKTFIGDSSTKYSSYSSLFK